MLCPELVGRVGETERLARRLDRLMLGQGGGLLAVVGEAGSGKSRLLRLVGELCDSRALRVLSGRAIAGVSPSPYRPLQEALLAAFRNEPLPASASLQGFEGHLGRLLPSAAPPAAEDSPVLVGEALVRLLAATAGKGGLVVLLEDMHWADPETVAVLDYLADALPDERVLCVCSSRPDGAIDDLLSRLDRADPGQVMRIPRLSDGDVARMVAACLETPEPPVAVRDFVAGHSDGNPLLVEELLAGLVASGQLSHDGEFWDTPSPLTPSVPVSLRESINRRLSSLAPADRRVIGAAALLGRHFEWDLLPGIAEVDGRAGRRCSSGGSGRAAHRGGGRRVCLPSRAHP